MCALVAATSDEASFVVRYGGLVVVVGVLLLMLLFFGWQQLGVRQRRKRFASRTPMNEDEWFRRMTKRGVAQREMARELLESLAREIGVSWNQLRPDDTFEAHLRISPRFAPWNDLDELEDILVRWASDRGIRHDDLPPFEGTLADILDRILELDAPSISP